MKKSEQFDKVMKVVTDAYRSGCKDLSIQHRDGNCFWNRADIDGTVRIYTRFARGDFPGRTNGDYDFWLEIFDSEDGLHIRENWSADYDPERWLSPEEIFPDITLLDLIRDGAGPLFRFYQEFRHQG